MNFLASELPGLVAAAPLVLALAWRSSAIATDVERLFNRAVVYGALTAGVVGIFAIFAWLVGRRLNDSAFGIVLAAVVVALSGRAGARMAATAGRPADVRPPRPTRTEPWLASGDSSNRRLPRRGLLSSIAAGGQTRCGFRTWRISSGR